MPDRRVDIAARSRIEQIEVRYRKSTWQMWLAIIGLYLAAGVGIWQNHVASDKIQSSRVESLRLSCEESNGRHDRTVAAFRREFAGAVQEVPPSQRKRAKASLEANIRLINVFVPVHKDKQGRSTCRLYAEERAAAE